MKEAAYKAFYPRSIISWKDIMIEKEKGRPRIVDLSGKLEGIQHDVSISHDGEYITSIVICK